MTLGALLERGGRPGDEEASFPSLRLHVHGFGRIFDRLKILTGQFAHTGPFDTVLLCSQATLNGLASKFWNGYCSILHRPFFLEKKNGAIRQ